jgi:hypothetical protein
MGARPNGRVNLEATHSGELLGHLFTVGVFVFVVGPLMGWTLVRIGICRAHRFLGTIATVLRGLLECFTAMEDVTKPGIIGSHAERTKPFFTGISLLRSIEGSEALRVRGAGILASMESSTARTGHIVRVLIRIVASRACSP